MGNDPWQQVKELFTAALECAPENRARFLDQHCAQNEQLRGELESLLANDPGEHDMDQDPSFAAALDLLSDYQIGSLAGRDIDGYHIERLIGHGGMGTVYLAAPRDGPGRLRVAIKFVKRGMDTDEVLRRFQNERRTLAALLHPNIARLLDGGTTSEGLPYLVMEYVEGRPIDQYCDEQRLSVVQRLRLFLSVCEAVQYAHQNLVVHRDLKPGNIVVTDDGVPKLLDFGIAKLLMPDDQQPETCVTQDALRMLTPEYASPEQIIGRNITTASDIYSLGVILYKLLSGHRPYRFKTRDRHELERVICDDQPPLPSTAVRRSDERPQPDGTTETRSTPEQICLARSSQPDRLRRRLRGDLDRIVLMALRKEPHRRYASVEQFAEDIRRHLKGLPVVAHGDTVFYAAGKFIRRNKALVATAALLVISLIVGIVGTTREAMRAKRVGRDARIVTEFLHQVFASPDAIPGEGNYPLRRVYDQAAANINQRLSNESSEVRAQLYDIIGQGYTNVGCYPKARSFLEKALAIRREAHGYDHALVAATLNALARSLQYDGQYQAAARRYREALGIRRELFGMQHVDVAESLNGLAELMREQGDYRSAEEHHREALQIRRRLLGENHPDVAESAHNLGAVLHQKGAYEDAEEMFHLALRIRREKLGENHARVATTLRELGTLKHARGDYAAADELLSDARDILINSHGRDHPAVANVLSSLAVARKDHTGDYHVESLYRDALAIQQATLGKDHPQTLLTMNNLATLLAEFCDYEAAEQFMREGLELASQRLGAKHNSVADRKENLAMLLYHTDRSVEAEKLCRESLEIRIANSDSDPRLTSLTRTRLSLILSRLERKNEAQEQARIALGTLREIVPQDHPDVATALLALGIARQDPQETLACTREALDIRRTKFSEKHVLTAEAKSELAKHLIAQEQYGEAEHLLVEAMPVFEETFGAEHLKSCSLLVQLVALYEAWGKPEKADQLRADLARRRSDDEKRVSKAQDL